jgi:hypothetical protein
MYPKILGILVIFLDFVSGHNHIVVDERNLSF